MAKRGIGDPREKLSDLCTDFFLLGLQIASGLVELPNCETLRRRVLQLFEVFAGRAQKSGFLQSDVDDARYALAAYLDEIIHYSNWPGRTEWSANPLQAILFGESRAGARFFERLMDVRRRECEAVHVFYLCLVLGFMGEFRLAGEEDLQHLIDDMRRELIKGSVKRLSVHGKGPGEEGLGGRLLPLLPVAGISLALSVIVVILLYFLLGSAESKAVELLQQLGRT